jgi:plasmid stabilization system protein ParE
MAKLDINLKARFDLVNIKIYFKEHSALNAYDKIELRIFKSLKKIAEFPKSGTLVKIEKLKKYRFHFEKPYYIFYTYSNDTVVIQRIIHGSRDIEKALK